MQVAPKFVTDAYRQSAFSNIVTPDKLGASLGFEQTQTQNIQGSPFSELVKSVVGNAVENNHKAEEISARAVAGQASVSEVVEAIANAEASLRTITTIRDRVVSAYQEILRTPI
jgi:flagellar hook-basal body complex protein FliE